MPYIQIRTNVRIDEAQSKALKSVLGKDITLLPGKSEAWLMVEIEDQRKLFFQGSEEACAIAEIKLYGSSDPESYQKLTAKITAALQQLLNLRKERVYVEYEETEHWGYAGENF